MTVDLLEELETLTPQLAGAVETVRLDEAAKKALEQLKTARLQAERFSAAVQIVRLLERQSEPAVRTALLRAKHQAAEVGEALQEATDAAGVHAAASTFTDGFSGELATLDAAVRETWRGVVFHDYDALRVMGALLEKIDETRPLGDSLLATGQQARALIETRPPLPALKVSIEALQEKAAALRDDLRHIGEDDPDIDAFLKALVVNQATARHLRPAVLVWLEKNHALDIFAVRAA